MSPPMIRKLYLGMLQTRRITLYRKGWRKQKKKLVLANRRLKLREIPEEMNISEGSVFTILLEHLSMRKLCSKWVLRLLTVDQKQQRVDDSDFTTVFCLSTVLHNQTSMSSNFIVFHTSGGISSRLVAFLLLTFCQYYVNFFQCLISSW